MDIALFTLKKQWEQLKSEVPGIQIQHGSSILGCSSFELVHVEFGDSSDRELNNLIVKLQSLKKDLLALDSTEEPFKESNHIA